MDRTLPTGRAAKLEDAARRVVRAITLLDDKSNHDSETDLDTVWMTFDVIRSLCLNALEEPLDHVVPPSERPHYYDRMGF